MLSLESDKCCGCTACVSSCPQQCLEMIASNEGFLVPNLKEEKRCVECNLCNTVCPVISFVPEIPKEQIGYIVQNTNEEIRKQSTSGGAFSAISEYVIDIGGIVYGATYDENFEVRHIGIETKDELWRFRNSKYVQSILGDTFIDIKKHLKNGRFVCFSGTPCQIEGLNSFLRKRYDNLLMVDVVCHGIGSPLIWKKYLETQTYLQPDNIYFRWKHYGYKYSTMSFFKDGKEVYFGGVETDSMLRSYFTNSCDRLICYDCPFKKRYRVSDITMWDCFQPRYFNKKFDDDKGTTSVLIHSVKGMRLFEAVLNNNYLNYYQVDADKLVFGNKEMVQSVPKGKERDTLFRDSLILSGEELFNKYYPKSFGSIIKKSIRLILLKLRIYSVIKYCLYLIRRKK